MRPTALALILSALAALPLPATPREAGRDRSGPYGLEVLGEDGRPLPTFQSRGRTWVLGELGARYALRVRNGSPRRIEVVASVDGRDVVDGRPAALEKRGYLVEPWSEVTIDGFRLSRESVAAFRFSSVARSYAARTGDARDVGVIGAAIFPERERPRPVPRPLPRGPEEQGAAPGTPGGPSSPEAKGSSDAAPAARGSLHAERRPGLGTEFGEARDSPVELAPFVRARAEPDALLAVRYDDRDGLRAQGIDVDGRFARRDEAWLRETARPFPASPGYARPPPGWSP